jgi:hypothetical protein
MKGKFALCLRRPDQPDVENTSVRKQKEEEKFLGATLPDRRQKFWNPFSATQNFEIPQRNLAAQTRSSLPLFEFKSFLTQEKLTVFGTG